MAERLYYVDLTAGETTAKYPSDGHGGNTATRASALEIEDVGPLGTEFVVIGVIVLDLDTTPANTELTITGENGATYVVTIDGTNSSDYDYLPLPMAADLPSIVNAAPSFGSAVATLPGAAGVPVGRTFTAAMTASAQANFRVIFGVG